MVVLEILRQNSYEHASNSELLLR